MATDLARNLPNFEVHASWAWKPSHHDQLILGMVRVLLQDWRAKRHTGTDADDLRVMNVYIMVLNNELKTISPRPLEGQIKLHVGAHACIEEKEENMTSKVGKN